jgi:hypothetical protein
MAVLLSLFGSLHFFNVFRFLMNFFHEDFISGSHLFGFVKMEHGFLISAQVLEIDAEIIMGKCQLFVSSVTHPQMIIHVVS